MCALKWEVWLTIPRMFPKKAYCMSNSSFLATDVTVPERHTHTYTQKDENVMKVAVIK